MTTPLYEWQILERGENNNKQTKYASLVVPYKDRLFKSRAQELQVLLAPISIT